MLYYSYSTNDDYNNILINMTKNRRKDEDNGKSPYRYVYCSEDKMGGFERDHV